jgi:UDP-hydrolysing UDP-N-acetyl-D-glucosamine 2-epimerase
VAVALKQCGAEALMLVGDRSETLAAGLAATCLRLPIVHLHGGEETTGAIDNACRHALSKLAHLHAVSHASFRTRLIAMGEAPGRVVVSGAPAIDLMLSTAMVPAAELERHLGLERLGAPLVLFTHHPTTLGGLSPQAEIAAVLGGLERALVGVDDARVVMTRANADTGGAAINAALVELARRDPRFVLAHDLGSARWWSLLALAQVMVGNSSSGILEAPSFSLPVVNIGERQHGRLRVHPVIDVPADAHAIAGAIERVLADPRVPAPPRPSPYGDGQAARRIRAAVEALAALPPAKRLAKTEDLP